MARQEREPLTPTPTLSLVIPAYNESANIRQGVLQRVEEYLAAQSYSSEVVVVDDGSEDDTPALVEELARGIPRLRLVRERHLGKAHAVRAGVLAARGQYIVFTDMDLSTPLHHIADALTWLRRGYPVVIGSRLAKGATRSQEPPLRWLLGRAFSLLVRLLLLPSITDSQCGFKAFRREVAQELFQGLRVFRRQGEVKGPRVTAFDVELLFLARRRGYRIKEVPVRWHHVPSQRVNLFREPARMLGEVLLVKLYDLRGLYREPR